MPKRPKRAAVAVAPTAKKAIPKRQPAADRVEAAEKQTIVIRFNRTDLGGPWCLTKISQPDHALLLDKIKSIETMTVHEVFNGNPGKDYEIDQLPNADAARRLEDDLPYSDQDQISRLQIAGKQRLYGFRQGNNFHVLWWDPEHEIWPSKR